MVLLGMETHVPVCDYGCNSPAQFVLKNGRGCCSDNPQRCPALRKRASDRQLGEANSFFGKIHTEETRKSMSEAGAGEKNAFFGKSHTENSRQKISSRNRGQLCGTKNPMFGKPRDPSVKHKISKKRVELCLAKGSNNPNWKGGTSRSRSSEMRSTRYKEWRKAVFERDEFRCQMCGKRGGYLEADHITPWACSVELRYEITNGRTLCLKCHRTTFKDIRIHMEKTQRAG